MAGLITIELGQDHCLIRVTDTGTGIPPKTLPHLFNRYYRNDKASTPTKEGSTGPCLAITKTIIQAHGGSMSVENRLNHGSSFEIRLPKGP